MTLLDIRVLGDPILRQETTPVDRITDELRQLIDDMFETMRVAGGIGLAAPQVGRSERIAVIEVDESRFALVNPEIVFREGAERAEEGCLSIPEIYGDVERATRVIVHALDRNEKPITVDGSALLARCLQHEVDHLHGKLFIDYLSVLKRRAALAKWTGMRADYPGFVRRIVPEAGAGTEASNRREP